MEFKDYQEKAHGTSLNTSICGNETLYPVLGIVGEAGEIAEKFKKLHRDCGGIANEAFKTDIIKELGDVLWCIAELCTKLEIDMDTVAATNIEKLYSRKERGQLHGSGDNR